MSTITDIPVRFEEKFAYYEEQLPTVESRIDFARQLAVGDPEVSEIDSQFTSRFVLASLWGEDRDALRELAFNIYALKLGIEYNVEQPVVVLKSDPKGRKELDAVDRGNTHIDFGFTDPNTLLQRIEGGGDDRLEHDVEIDFGLVDTNILVPGFAGTLANRGSTRLGVKPPFIGFGLKIPVRNLQNIKVDVLGNCSQEPATQRVTEVVFFWGVAPLIFDIKAYEAQRQKRQRTVFLGDAATSILAHLATKTTDGSHDRLSELALST